MLLILLLLIADVSFVSASEFQAALQKPEIRAAFRLTLLTCTLAALLSVWVATPLGYLLSRFSFPARGMIDVLVDIPIVLPPLVLGLSLLILFHQPFPLSRSMTIAPSTSVTVEDQGEGQRSQRPGDQSTREAAGEHPGWILETWLRKDLGFPVTYQWPAVVLAQFAVSCAFAIRTMRVTFDQISPRAEDVARTLGCSRSQAFLQVALPQAWKGVLTAFTISWARALGEFGPILVFAGATRFRTEVLSTSVFLELSVGQLDAAVAVSLMMVAMAVLVLLILRGLGTGLSP